MIDTVATIASYRADIASNPRKPGRVSPANATKGTEAAAIAKRAIALAAQPDNVRTMAELRAAGLTFAAIAETFNAANIPTRNGARWAKGNVYRTLALHS
jgi:hypothetical protein